ncbi:hypothetical protein LXL04_021296 [Taraxacum kok-saghyz]
MKQSPPYVFLLLLIVTTHSLFSSTTASEDIRDSTGDKVLNNAPYHIGPVTTAKGGPIKLTDTINDKKICPLIVEQDPSADNIGGEFMFTLFGKREYLRTSSGLSIDSYSPTGECDESTYWTIPDAEGSAPSNLITTGGGFDQAITCFQVVEYSKPTSPSVHSYMLQHCPSFCGAGPSTCFNISIYIDNGVRRLSSTGATPFEFVFYKVTSTHDSM